jgi:hypothetical protein
VSLPAASLFAGGRSPWDLILNGLMMIQAGGRRGGERI